MIKPENTNSEFDLGGINHVALVCADMAKTVDFYTGVLGMPLVKSLDLPGGMGQHFFFDAGNGDCVAFFWFAEAPDGVPGVSAPAAIPGIGRSSARWVPEPPGVPRARGEVRRIPPSPQGQGRTGRSGTQPRREPGPGVGHPSPGVYVRSFYFQDPDGITLEFACWTKQFKDTDTVAEPKTEADRRRPVSAARQF